ncbi:MAG: hypothetical protein EON58_23245 [Alphaproteobacteria bacterium]|nr:MAG: hypothetical protein EON58_23245 [Alphaproteobacteria bacterium]
MSISEHRAVEIATAFVKAHGETGAYAVSPRAPSVSREVGGPSSKLFGVGENYWSVLFDLETPADAVVDPDHVIVLVDALTGKPVWFPIP